VSSRRTASTVAPEPLVVRTAVAEQNAEQDARVELGAVRRPDVALLVVRPAAALDEATDRLALLPPVVDAPCRQDATLGEVDRTIERDPAHHLRLGEVHRLAPHLPDAGVRTAPEPADQVGDLPQPNSEVPVERVPRPGVYPGGLQELAVGVELELVHRGIAKAHRL